MIRHVWSVFCSKAAVDQQTNSVSLFEVIEELRLEVPQEAQFPAVLLFEGVLVSYWTRTDPDRGLTAEQRLRFLSPDGAELGQFIGKIDVEAGRRSRTFIRFNQIRLAGPGRHEWEVAWRKDSTDAWTVVGSVPVDLTVVKHDAVAAAPT